MRVNEAQLADWGRTFAGTLAPPATVGVSGELGAGKTTLIRAIAAALGVREPVTSPTFALVHRYEGPAVTVYHVDAYRLRRPEDARDLGIEDMQADPRAVVLVEWPERLGHRAPAFTHRIALGYADEPGARQVEAS